MAREGQFEKDKHTLACGIEVNALRVAGEYRVYFGNNKSYYYDITYSEALAVYAKYGKNAITKRGSKKVFILPIFAFRSGKSNWDEKEYEKKEDKRLKVIQERLL